MANLRDKILNAKDIKEETVTVDEWGVTVLVIGLNGSKRAALLQRNIDQKGNVNLERMFPEVVILTAHDPETREPIFELTDVDALNKKSGAAIDKLATIGMKLSGLNPEDLDKAEKN